MNHCIKRYVACGVMLAAVIAAAPPSWAQGPGGITPDAPASIAAPVETSPAATPSGDAAIPLPPAIAGGENAQASGPVTISPPRDSSSEPVNPVADPMAWDQTAPAPVATPPAVAEPLPDTPPTKEELLPEKPQEQAVAPVVLPVEQKDALDARVTALEKEIIDLKKDMVSKNDLDKLRDDLTAKNTARPVDAALRDVHASPKKAKQKPRRKKVVAKGPVPVTRWVLKSAKPGVALVAPPGSNELKSVTVGDALPGVGKIKSISLDSMGKWVISGSSGYVNQK